MTDYPPLAQPVAMPSGPMQAHQPVGDAQSDAARAAAINARGTLANRYNTDNLQFSSDVDAYVEADENWERVKTNMTSTDRMTCYSYISTAYQHLGNERNYLVNAINATAAGDSDIDQGDALPANQSQQKTQKYMSASQCYTSATNYCASAESEHTSYAGALASAWGIMNHYG